MIEPYGKVAAIDDARLLDQLKGEDVVIQEKVDGSQFSARVVNGEWSFRSKGKAIDPHAPPALFAPTVSYLRSRPNRPPEGVTLRGEAMATARHNILTYDRVPRGHLVLFDAERPDGSFYSEWETQVLAAELGIDATRTYYSGKFEGLDWLRGFLGQESFLGGVNIEGIVVKARHKRNPRDLTMLKAKLVCPEFKERHVKDWKPEAAPAADILQQIAESVSNEPRWQKAVQRLREAETLDGSVKDIGPLIKSVQSDVMEEEREFIMAQLFAWAAPKLRRLVSRPVPEWY